MLAMIPKISMEEYFQIYNKQQVEKKFHIVYTCKGTTSNPIILYAQYMDYNNFADYMEYRFQVEACNKQWHVIAYSVVLIYGQFSNSSCLKETDGALIIFVNMRCYFPQFLKCPLSEENVIHFLCKNMILSQTGDCSVTMEGYVLETALKCKYKYYNAHLHIDSRCFITVATVLIGGLKSPYIFSNRKSFQIDFTPSSY